MTGSSCDHKNDVSLPDYPAVRSKQNRRSMDAPRCGEICNRLCSLCLRLVGCDLGLRDGPVRIADFEAGKTADSDVLAQLADFLRNQVLDRNGLFLDERLFKQADFLVEL